MTRFRIEAVDDRTGQPRELWYDNETSELTDDAGVDLAQAEPRAFEEYRWTPRKAAPRVVKVSLGLACNYSCTYCSQRFVPHSDQTGEAVEFLKGLPRWYDGGPAGDGSETRFEFWGGEPLVYWKRLRVLAAAIRGAYPRAEFSIVTNGSLLDAEKNDFLVMAGFRVGLSHDGPGQRHRGPDPLDGPARGAILDLYRRLKPEGRFSFNAMLHRDNLSRAAVLRFFRELTGDEDVPIGEGGMVDAYDHGSLSLSLPPAEEVMARRLFFAELPAVVANMGTVAKRVEDFLRSVKHRRPAAAVAQKCGMDRPDSVAVDLAGAVLTCQNASSAATAPNGESHRIGSTSDWDNIELKTARHWSTRDACRRCPVLQLCKGSCMFLEGDLFDASCRNAYADHVATFARAVQALTGATPQRIVGPHPAERHDLWS